MDLFKLTVIIDGKDKTFMTLASDTEEAVTKVRKYLEEKELVGKIAACSPKGSIVFVQ